MKRYLILLLTLLLLCACKGKVDYTSISIQDPVRHYYPILQGQELTIAVRIDNIGDVPLVIKDIQPSCGCIIVEPKREIVLPPDKFMYVVLTYDSKKNVGKVEHAIRFWGNILPEGRAEMRFDVNVVPDANKHMDYEELYEQDPSRVSVLKDLVDGMGSQTGLGYYTDL